MGGIVTVLIVDYNAGELLERCIASLDRDPVTAEAPVVVVDNASTDDGARDIAARFPRVRVVRLDVNRGFGAANNAGLPLVETPFVLMINPDTEVLSGSARAFVDDLASSPRGGLSGCRILDAEGRLQKTVRYLPTVLREATELLFLHRVLPRRAERFVQTVHAPEEYDAPRSAGWVSGCAMLARTDALREVGGFDEGFYLYAEETDLCKRLADAGWEIRYDPALTLLHIGGAFTTDPALALENQRSKLRYFLKHEGRAAMLAYAGVAAERLLLRGTGWAVVGRLRGNDRMRARGHAAFTTLRDLPGLLAEFAATPPPVTLPGAPSTGKESA